MPILPENIVRHELIGLEVKIKKSTNPSQIGLKGIVIDETYNMIKIEVKEKEKLIQKGTSIFIFALPNGKKVEVDGKILIGRPEDRIKKKLPRW
jgi:ribonuclease P protein subunit POP4